MGAARKAWDAAKHPRGPNGRFIKGGGGSQSSSLAEAVLGTAASGPKRQRSSARDLMGGGPSRKPASGHMMDRHNTTEQQYVTHFNNVTDEQLHASARNSGVRTEGRPREAIVRDLAAVRAREDRQALEVNAQANAAKAENSQRLTAGSAPAARTPAAKPRTARSAFDSARAAGVDRQLASATSRADAERALSGLSMAQLRAVASSHGVTLRSKTTKANAITAIVASVVGRRLDSNALSRL
jgi:hypothetical protein